jgi:hypothetical protein
MGLVLASLVVLLNHSENPLDGSATNSISVPFELRSQAVEKISAHIEVDYTARPKLICQHNV